MPVPRITRPPVNRSSVLTCLASSTGSRSGSTSTAVPSRMRVVRAPTAARVTSTS